MEVEETLDHSVRFDQPAPAFWLLGAFAGVVASDLRDLIILVANIEPAADPC